MVAGSTMPLPCWCSSCCLTALTLLMSTKRNLPELSSLVRKVSVMASVSMCSEVLLRMESMNITGRPPAVISEVAGEASMESAILSAMACKSEEP